MLLKVGAAMMLFTLVLAAGVATVVSFQGEEAPSTTALSSTEEPQAAGTPAEEEREFEPGEKLKIDDEPGKEPAPGKGPAPKSRPDPATVANWPRPTNNEVASAAVARYFNPQPDEGMSLTVEALGLYDVPVISSNSVEALDTSLMHVPETSLPWDEGAQRNVYISGHYLGWPGTASRLVFYNLDKLQNGDEVVLKDGRGGAYRYGVSESFMAWPEESWVMGQELNRDMLTLQTCIPPDFGQRLIVRADRV
jgi:sortase A